jgi:hypothetical protein
MVTDEPDDDVLTRWVWAPAGEVAAVVVVVGLEFFCWAWMTATGRRVD